MAREYNNFVTTILFIIYPQKRRLFLLPRLRRICGVKKLVTEKKVKKSSARNVFGLGFVSFFTDMSTEMIFSLLPTFLLGMPGSSRAILGF
jgi:hypothetical protein